MQHELAEPVRAGLYIGGREVITLDTVEIMDPARPGTVVGFGAVANATHIDEAISSAHSATAVWAELSVAERAAHMARAIEGLDARRDEFATILTSEIGKTHHESWVDAKVFEIRWKLVHGLAESFTPDTVIEPDASTANRTVVQRRPVGPVTIIVPFNWPLAILAASLPHALLAGNPVIVKAPASAPLATAVFVSAIAAQLPPGVLNVVSGHDDTMAPLIADPRIGKVCFTGSVGGGKEIARIAASAVTPVTLELGGNDAAIIFDDTQLDTVSLDRLFSSIFDTSGQICMNAKRIYVHESRKDELLAGLRERLATVKLGHGLDEGVTHGPLHTARQAAWVNTLISEARAAGATVEQFGELPDGELADGHFVLPTLVIDPDPSLRIVTEEQFGPVIPIMTFATEAEAVEAANDTWAGLGASVWTEDPARATRVAERLDAGYVWINDHGAPRLDLRAPFGGTKFSGYGREQGIEGVLEFTQTRAVSRHGGDR